MNYIYFHVKYVEIEVFGFNTLIYFSSFSILGGNKKYLVADFKVNLWVNQTIFWKECIFLLQKTSEVMQKFRKTLSKEFEINFRNNDINLTELFKEYDVIDYLIKSQYLKGKKK